jgi:hypothetical protein
MIELIHVPTEGQFAGKPHTPHRHPKRNMHYVVSPTRYEKDYKEVNSIPEALPYLAKGWGIRVSTKGAPPSLVFMAT